MWRLIAAYRPSLGRLLSSQIIFDSYRRLAGVLCAPTQSYTGNPSGRG
ncbi:MAG: hypothetical protein IIA14_00215 [SAR324 cluster bacterium]|nr:hypothetical protein [SAR324 cluster bacterium]